MNKKIKLKNLTFNIIKRYYENHLALPIDIKDFIDEGLFSKDWGKITKSTSTRERNKILKQRKKFEEEGFVLDVVTLGAMVKIYDNLSPEFQKKINNEIKNPYKLLMYIDSCWDYFSKHRDEFMQEI